MEKFTIYFELFGKKMKTEIQARSESEAKQKLFDKIVFHKIEKKDSFSEMIKMMDDIVKNL